MVVSALRSTCRHARQFREEGFFVLKQTVPPGDLDTLRGECQRFTTSATGRWTASASRSSTSTGAAAATSSTHTAGAQQSSASVPDLMVQITQAALKGHRLPVQRAIRREGRRAGDAVQAGTKTRASSTTRTGRTSPAGSHSTT